MTAEIHEFPIARSGKIERGEEIESGEGIERLQQAARQAIQFYCDPDVAHNYAVTQCPRCSQQAGLYRTGHSVLLVCTKCDFKAQWVCVSRAQGGGRVSDPDDEIPW